jgi:hypothetical protein
MSKERLDTGGAERLVPADGIERRSASEVIATVAIAATPVAIAAQPIIAAVADKVVHKPKSEPKK